MTITYAQLVLADTDMWRAAGAAWRRLAAVAADEVRLVRGATRDLAEDWHGKASRAALEGVSGLGTQLDGLRLPCRRTEQVLNIHADRVRAAQAMISETVASTQGSRIEITDNGSVRLDVAGGPPQVWESALLNRAAEGIRAALDLADRSDVETHRALSELTADRERSAAADPPGMPPGGGPHAVRLWWSGLTAAQRFSLMRQHPELIGTLDGIPAADRDLANRELLAGERTRLADLRDTLRGQDGAERELARIEACLSGLAAIEARLSGDAPRAYLLGLDTSGDGRAIVSLGDPDHADHVLTFVPGAGCGLDRGIGGALDRTAAMGAAAAVAEPSSLTAAILWLGYDTPDDLAEAMSASQAHQARTALHDFQEGLRAAHQGTISQQTVIGHSYGSLVVGETARDLGIAADDLVFIGSAGVGVAHAADLHVDPGTVWSSHADRDPIQYAAPSITQILRDLPIGRYYGDPMEDLWHGHNPSDPGFGGHTFASADGGALSRAHSSYWDPGNPALDAIGLIASGNDEELRR